MPAAQREHKAQPGDIIKIYRVGYHHWVVYIGDDEVVGLPGPVDGYGDIPCLVDGEAEVTREKIWDVIRNDKFRVCNVWDGIREPRNKEIIIKEACERVGEKLEFKWTTKNSEHFAKELRYGLIFCKVEVHAFSPKLHNAKPGDLIEIFRPLYQHWVVYIGSDEVVGLTSPENGDGVWGNLMKGEAEVRRQNIWRVIDDDDFRVNNYWDDECESRKVADIIVATMKCVGKTQPYYLYYHNCEHFATEQRYGEGTSRQAGWGAYFVGLPGRANRWIRSWF